MIALGLTHDSHKSYAFFRTAAEKVLWPRVEPQYREELKGIAEGLKARGVALDLWDVVAMNAWLELSPYYTDWYDKQHQLADSARPVPEHCSAFVAMGSYTRDGKAVIAHNNWTEYKEGSRWNIIFDIAPSEGYHILMDGMPGLIHSGDDFGVNSAGLAITETTIGNFSGFDPQRHPRVRTRAQSHAICRFHRRFRPHHGRRQQRRLCQHLADRRHAATKKSRAWSWA